MWVSFCTYPVPTHLATLTEVCSEDTAYRRGKAGSFLENSAEKINRFHQKKPVLTCFDTGQHGYKLHWQPNCRLHVVISILLDVSTCISFHMRLVLTAEMLYCQRNIAVTFRNTVRNQSESSAAVGKVGSHELTQSLRPSNPCQLSQHSDLRRSFLKVIFPNI